MTAWSLHRGAGFSSKCSHSPSLLTGTPHRWTHLQPQVGDSHLLVATAAAQATRVKLPLWQEPTQGSVASASPACWDSEYMHQPVLYPQWALHLINTYKLKLLPSLPRAIGSALLWSHTLRVEGLDLMIIRPDPLFWTVQNISK